MKVGLQQPERRRGSRVKVRMPVHVMSNGRRCAYGGLTELSCYGALINVIPLLAIGEHYIFYLPEIGRFDGNVVRRFGADSHAVEFDIDGDQRKRIDAAVAKFSE